MNQKSLKEIVHQEIKLILEIEETGEEDPKDKDPKAVERYEAAKQKGPVSAALAKINTPEKAIKAAMSDIQGTLQNVSPAGKKKVAMALVQQIKKSLQGA